MTSAALQLFAIFLASVGFGGDIAICVLPMWKVSAFVGNNIMTAQSFWEGLWMNCVEQSTGQLQCQFHTSMLALPQELQVARALIVISIMVAFLGLQLAIAGGKCTDCIDDLYIKNRVTIAAGVFFIVGGILCMVPVSWCANEIIKTFYNPAVHDAQKSELGAALFIGWVSASLLIIGGAFLSCRRQRDGHYSVKYSAPRFAAFTKAYV